MKFDFQPSQEQEQKQKQNGSVSMSESFNGTCGIYGNVPQSKEQPTPESVRQSHDLVLQEEQSSMEHSRELTVQKMKISGELQILSDKMDITKPDTIMQFGGLAASELASVANEVINRTKGNENLETAKVINNLAKIMEEVEINDFKEEQSTGLIGRVFNNGQKKLEKFISKYDTVGKKIESVQVQLRSYEDGIKSTNKDLEKMYENAISSYGTLVQYVEAGDHAVGEVEAYIANMEKTLGDMRAGKPNVATDSGYSIGEIELQLNNVRQSKQLLVQRVQDLRVAESVALQSIPMIKALQNGNLQLHRKIEQSLIVTVPIFQNAVAQALIMKRMSLQSKALEALDQKTNEMLLKNSKNTADIMQQLAGLSGESVVSVDTIEQSWKNIVEGIEGTRRIQEELERQRESDRKRLEEMDRKCSNQIMQDFSRNTFIGR